MNEEYSLKIGIIGKSKSGKTCLIQKYFTGIFESEYHKTIFLQVYLVPFVHHTVNLIYNCMIFHVMNLERNNCQC